MLQQTVRRCRSNGAQPDAFELPNVAGARLQSPHERVHAVRARKHHPVEAGYLGNGLIDRGVVFRWQHAYRRRLHGFSAQGLQSLYDVARLLTRARHEHPLPEQRPFIEPSQMLSERRHAADDEDGRTLVRRLLGNGFQFVKRALDGLLSWERAVVNNRRRLVLGPSVRDERMEDAGQLAGTGITHDRTFQPRQARPVHLRQRVFFVLVAANQCDGISGPRIGHRDTGVARNTHGRRNSRNDLEPHALLVEKQGFFSAAIEHERIPPLQSRDGLAFTCFFGQKVTDSLLLQRLWRGGAHVDLFRVGPCEAKKTRIDETIVKHHIRVRETLQPAHANQPRVARAGSNQVNDGFRGGHASGPVRIGHARAFGFRLGKNVAGPLSKKLVRC